MSTQIKYNDKGGNLIGILFGYRFDECFVIKEWRKFELVIEKAKDSCKNIGQKLEYHFVSSDKMI